MKPNFIIMAVTYHQRKNLYEGWKLSYGNYFFGKTDRSWRNMEIYKWKWMMLGALGCMDNAVFDLPALSFFLPSWRAVQFYRPHLEVRDPIWGDDWSHSPFIRRSPSWGFQGFSPAVMQIPDLCTTPVFILLLPLSLATDVTLGAIGYWLGTRKGSVGTVILA